MSFFQVETLLDRDYDVNLEVTALCAKLAYLPHPYTHEYLLNPTIPLTSRFECSLTLNFETNSPQLYNFICTFVAEIQCWS